MIKIGCFSNVEHGKSFEAQLKKIAELGFKSSDIAESHSGGFLGSTYEFVPAISLDDNPAKIRRLFDKYGLEITDVCAHSNLLDPSSPAIFSTAEIMKAVKFAAALNVRNVITTEGEPKTEWGKSLSKEEAVLIVAEKLMEPLQLAQDCNVNILLEPHGPLTDSVWGMRAIMDKLGNPENLGVCLDTGNSWLGGADPVEMARVFKSKIRHVHWKDLGPEWEKRRGTVYGCGAATAPIGKGVIDIKGVFDILKDIPGTLYSTLEVRGEENLLESAKYLRSLGAK
jgi:inosose dehydratase